MSSTTAYGTRRASRPRFSLGIAAPSQDAKAAPQSARRMELRVLGPLELVAHGVPVPLRAPKQRRLLAALLVAQGRPLSADALVDAVWGESPPPSARKLVQVYASQLR